MSLPRLLATCAAALCLFPVAAAEAARPVTLTNGGVTAQFGDRGLVSLAGPERAPAVRFVQDEFAVAIGDRTYASLDLPLPARVAGKDRVAYTWAAAPYRLTVVYELAGGWSFISKQISVEGGERPYRVSEIVVFEANVSDPIVGEFVPKSARANLGTGDYGACLRFGNSRGLLVVAQNPFLEFRRDAQVFSLRYKPDLDWDPANGPLVADRGLLALYTRTGRVLPDRMLAEWKLGPGDAKPGMDEAEVESFTGMVRAFTLAKPARPVNVFVPWCLNDYQIDIGTAEGRAEYKRVLDVAAELGADYAIFAPTNSDLAKREDSTDDWSWENLLWAGFGQKIRKNEWNPRPGPIPPSVEEMLDYAAGKKVKLLAYVYPVLAFSQNPEWLTARKNNPKRLYGNLGFRSLQDWLIETLVAFHDRLGLGGYAFDHAFLNIDGTSRYAQWAGWRRVMEELRRRIPDIVIDGRQAYHLYGPWGWLAGSYPHPTFSDEQPESFVPFPDLHFDRVSANRERWTAYRYRNYEFAPSELVPGFITHQTSRADDTGEMPQRRTDRGIMLLPLRARDWDYLGWRYSLLSSIAVAGWNNVLDMIPARDLEEYKNFSDADRKWFRRWIDWTDTNKEFLRHTRTILGQPAIGKIDGTSAIIGNRGYIFLFNPNGRRLDAEFPLDATIGFAGSGLVQLKEIYPLENRLVGKPGAGLWAAGDRVSIPMDGGSALVLEVQPAAPGPAAPLLFGAPGAVTIASGQLSIDGARGEAGTSRELLVLTPPGATVDAVTVNGRIMPFTRAGASAIAIPVSFAGAAFSQCQQIGTVDPAFAGGRYSARFFVPQRVFDQLADRRKAWPIPWTAEDYRTTWLAPERLLLFVQIAEPDAAWEARLRIDGRAIELRKAYSAVRTAPRTFVGFYADLSLLAADREHTLELELPPLRPGQLQGVFFENVETQYTEATGPGWQLQTSGTTERLRAVSAVSERVAWASGNKGTVLRTDDGGAHWAVLPVPGAEGLDFRDIEATSDRTAYILSIGPGDKSRIYKTVDAGATWMLQFTNPDPRAFYDAIAFWDEQNGLAVGDPVDGRFTILRTSDGGRTWALTPEADRPQALPGDGMFAASGTCLTVQGARNAWIGTGGAAQARVIRTTDRGATWEESATPIVAGVSSAGVFSIAFTDALHGIIVGGDYRKEQEPSANIALTADGGRTWAAAGDVKLRGFRSAVVFIPGSGGREVIAVGPAGTDRSTDGGRTWFAFGDVGFHAVSVDRTGQSVWAVGEQGRVGRLANR